MKRKILLLVVIAITLCNFTGYIYANNGNTFYYGDDYITFSSDCELSYVQKQKIANTIMLDDISSYSTNLHLNATCSHTYATEYPLAVRHKVYALSPRCVSECYETKICTKCGDVIATLISSIRTSCCK